ncbi:phage holin family protein [Sphingomonas sp. S1-29]|uniref:phage holin family protein n=1 Tax=Sphingomonas sp. S1-29 TaxID=2991074 RepID=UPI00223EFF36|nr:phage holin family protein [Sphingomonas sp. S1-29]UZK70124.1 phage holin family protein [Sphingomonas sp. S1-29]
MAIGGDPQQPGVTTLVARTVEDAKRWSQAELAYYKALAGDRGGDAGVGIGFGVAALALAQAALIAALVGIVLTLTPVIGPGWATLVVVFATLALAGLLSWLALGKLRRATRPVSDMTS